MIECDSSKRDDPRECCQMEVNQVRRQLKDLEERMRSLRGYL